MMESVGSYSFENNEVFNPYDRNRYAKLLSKDTARILRILVEERFKNQNSVSAQKYLNDDRVVLAEELMSELLTEIDDSGIEVRDMSLLDMINTPSSTIDDDSFDPKNDIPWFRLLREAGFSKELVMKSYDLSQSSLPKKFLPRNEARLKIIEEVYEQ